MRLRNKQDRRNYFDYLLGLTTLPRNKIFPVFFSWIMNMNGWSALNISLGSGIAAADISITTAVAAAASVPFSSTLTYV